MSFTIGQIVVPSTPANADLLGVPVGTRLIVTGDSYGESSVKREDNDERVGTWFSERFEAAPPTGKPVVGSKVTILDVPSPNHYLQPGTEATITDIYGSGNVQVEGISKRTGEPGMSQSIHPDEFTLSTAPETVTLESFKIKFVEGALARAERNSQTHVEQVTEALNALAGYEFLSPSTTLEDFQQRVVALAMDAKGKHGWCEEPEKFLTEIGLGHLLPVKKVVTMTVEVTITVDPSEAMSDYEVRRRARRLVNDSVPGAYAHGASIV